jgi:hypothetical protein
LPSRFNSRLDSHIRVRTRRTARVITGSYYGLLPSVGSLDQAVRPGQFRQVRSVALGSAEIEAQAEQDVN